jgi:hypothetical protein
MISARSVALTFALVTLATPAVAQDVIYDEDGGHYVIVDEPPVVVRELPPVPPRQLRYAPRVYGWSSQVYEPAPRRTDCGTFRYWDGRRCADARFEPPAR